MVHYYWLVKSDIRLPVMYGVFVGVLLGYRVVGFGLQTQGAGRREATGLHIAGRTAR